MGSHTWALNMAACTKRLHGKSAVASSCLWTLLPGCLRTAHRGGSLCCLPACCVSVCCAGTVHYYQGLHDVASVLLLVAGEPAAFDMLCHLATGHLRDATRSSLDPVIELLGLMGPIVAAADPELASYLAKQGLPPFYALSWFITWFSHDLADFGEVRGAGLMAAAAVVGNRRRLARLGVAVGADATAISPNRMPA